MKPLNARHLGLVVACSLLTACVVSPGALNVQVPPGLAGASASPAASSSGAPQPTGSGAPAASAAPSSAPSAAAASNGEVEPNNDFPQATVIALGTAVKAQAGGSDAKGDYYKITLPAGSQAGWLKAEVDEADAIYGPSIEFFSADKSSIHIAYPTGGTQQPIPGKIRAAAGGSYFVKVAPHEADQTVAYTLRLVFEPVKDANEPNDTFEKANTLELGKKTAFASFWADDAPAEDMDYFKLVQPAGKSGFHVVITNKASNDEPSAYRVEIFNDKKESLHQLYSPGGQADMDEHVSNVTPGTYYLKLMGDNCSALSDLTVMPE